MESSPSGRWNDPRLDDLNERVKRLEPVVADVAVMKRDMRALTDAMKENTTATRDVARQIEEARMEPLRAGRKFWGQVTVAVLGAMVAGGCAVLGALLAAGHI